MQVVKRNNVKKYEIGWLKVAILVIAWLVIISLARDVWQIRTGFGRITESEKRLSAEEEKNISLKQKFELVKTDSYREKLVREKLNMQKEGEVIVVMPKSNNFKASETESEVVPEHNWEKWWSLIQ
jgi:cell division protein FtsB